MGDSQSRYKILDRGRKHLVIRYRDRQGRWRERTAGTNRRSEAHRRAREIIAQSVAKTSLAWDEFRLLYTSSHADSVLQNPSVWKSAANALERILNPIFVADITAGRLAHFADALREQGRSVSTVRTYLKHLRAMLRWGEARELFTAPRVILPRPPAQKSRGRAITGEEFERLMDACPDLELQKLMWLLWHTGLRLGEAMRLCWKEGGCPQAIWVDGIQRLRPVIVFPVGSHKGGVAVRVPLTPSATEFLKRLHTDGAAGRVINLRGARKPILSRDRAGRLITAIGERARVGSGGRWATAHDLRRSFGQRWAARVMPVTLMQMMRHRSISVTLDYYVGRDASALADAIWESGRGDNLGDIADSPGIPQKPHLPMP